jgi:hypothetical protein
MAPSSTPQPIVQLGSPEFGIFPQMVPVSQPSTSPPPITTTPGATPEVQEGDLSKRNRG